MALLNEACNRRASCLHSMHVFTSCVCIERAVSEQTVSARSTLPDRTFWNYRDSKSIGRIVWTTYYTLIDEFLSPKIVKYSVGQVGDDDEEVHAYLEAEQILWSTYGGVWGSTGKAVEWASKEGKQAGAHTDKQTDRRTTEWRLSWQFFLWKGEKKPPFSQRRQTGRHGWLLLGRSKVNNKRVIGNNRHQPQQQQQHRPQCLVFSQSTLMKTLVGRIFRTQIMKTHIMQSNHSLTQNREKGYFR